MNRKIKLLASAIVILMLVCFNSAQSRIDLTDTSTGGGGVVGIPDGYAGASGHPHDQDLNTTDNITFVNITSTGWFIGNGSLLTGIGGDGFVYSNWFNQNLNTTDSPSFAGLTLTGLNGFLKATAGVIGTSAITVSDISDISTNYLQLDGSNANQDIDISGYSFIADNITANAFFGDGGNLTGISESFNYSDWFNQQLNTTDDVTFTWFDILQSVNVSGYVDASYFIGDGGNLTNISYAHVHPFNYSGYNQDLNSTNNVTFWNVTATGWFIGNGSQLTGLTDNDTTYTSGAGLNLSGTIFSLNGSIFDQNLTWDGNFLNATVTGSTYTSGEGLNLTGSVFSFNISWGDSRYSQIGHSHPFNYSGYDQDLNSTDSPEFDDITLTSYPNLDKDSTDDITVEADPWFNSSVAKALQSSWMTNWNTSYSWGDHSGLYSLLNHWHNDSYYLKTVLNPMMVNWNESYSWGNHSLEGYLTTESDPVYSGDPASNITDGNITNWDEAYSWGDHSLVGYLTSLDDHWHNDSYFLKTILQPWMINWNDSYSWGNHSDANYLDLDDFPNADTDSTDDFSGDYDDLTNKPTNFSDDDLSDNNTDDLLEGSSNFYCTLARIQSLLSGQWLNLMNATFTNNITIGTKTITETNITKWDNGINIFNQDLNTTNAPTFTAINTGEGENELYDMNQNVLTSSTVEFENVTVDDTLDMSNGGVTWDMYVNGAGVLVWEMS